MSANQHTDQLCRTPHNGSYRVAVLIQTVKVMTAVVSNPGTPWCVMGPQGSQVLEDGDGHLLDSCFPAPTRGSGAHMAVKLNA